MTPEEKRLLIELAIVALSEASPDAQRRIERLLTAMENDDRDRMGQDTDSVHAHRGALRKRSRIAT